MRRILWLCPTATLALGSLACQGTSAAGADGGDHPDSGVADGGLDAGPGDAGMRDAGPADAGSDAGPGRAALLAATGVQASTDTVPSFIQWTPAALAADVDVVGFFGEFYGIPWSSFAADAGPFPAWAQTMQGLASQAQAPGKPVFLSLTLGRNGLINEALPTDGGFITQSNWASCFDFEDAGGPAMKQAYLAYVTWMIDAFQPSWINVAVEVNLYGVNCPQVWPGVVDTVNAAYSEAKSLAPTAVVFESFAIDPLYQDLDAGYAQIAQLQRDRFGVSAYPSMAPSQIPADYFVRAANLNPAGPEQVVIAETGYNSVPLVVATDAGTCATLVPNTPANEAAYMTRLFADAQTYGFQLVDWWSDEDLLPEPLMTNCPCTYSAAWCAIEGAFEQIYGNPSLGDLNFKGFGSMGLRDYDGGIKETIYDVWQAYRAMPL